MRNQNLTIAEKALLIFTGLHLLGFVGRAQSDIIDFESDQWVMKNAEIVQYLDRKCLIGYAYLKDVEFENGIIEVELAVEDNRVRSYPGLIFRMQSEENYERLYIRPHRSPLYPDALQYTPVINGIAGWQLFNGEGFTAGAKIPEKQWIHLKIEISGKQARVYLDDRLALAINELKHGVSKGTIGLFGSRNRIAYFSNFKYKIDNSLKFAPVPEVETPPGTLTEWQLSQTFKLSQIDLEKHLNEQELGNLEWQKVSPEPSGLVDIARYVGRSGREPDCILAKTILHTNEAKTMQLMFGYSDAVSIFLNGRILFFGNSAYRQRDPSFLGVIGYNDAVFLPLKKGENELLLIVAEGFGGWGFMCKDGDAVFEHASLKKKWEINQNLKMPESAIYDKKRDILYITNFDRYGIPGQQFISKVSLDGTIKELKWVEGLVRPLGMTIFEDKLFVVERRNIAEIDLEFGKILKRYPLPKPVFPNDIAIDKSGHIYVSDSPKDVIYRYSQGKFEVWLKGDMVDDPNSLFIHKNQLIVGNSGDHSMKSVDLSSKKIKTITKFSTGIMDGIKLDENGNYLFSHYEGRIYRVIPGAQITKLLDVPNSRCADFDYIPEKNLIIIPTLDDGKVMAYQLSKKE